MERLLHRRGLVLSLRSLMLLMIVFGLWMGRQAEKARDQRQAVAMIMAFGGSVRYADEFSGGKPIPGGRPWAPVWLRGSFGEDFFRRVVQVDLSFDGSRGEMILGSNPRAADEGLKLVGRLSSLEELIVTDTEHVTDAGIAYLGGLKHLKRLVITGSKVTDKGVRALGGLESLVALGLDGDATRLTSTGLDDLVRLDSLEELSLTSTRLTDADLKKFEGLKNLKSVCIYGSQITETGVAALHKALPGLAKLQGAATGPQWSVQIHPPTGQATLGHPDAVRAKIEASFPSVSWTRPDALTLYGRYLSECHTYGFLLRPAPIHSLHVEVAGGAGAIPELQRFVRANGWILGDSVMGAMVSENAPNGRSGSSVK